MDAFRRGHVQVLVCTAVVEVGVDVPNATLMTIEGGQRFGLAQLHQLRGRIGRGKFPGFCCVFAEPQSDEAQQRLKAFVETSDGFQLAEKDFQLRGPGELARHEAARSAAAADRRFVARHGRSWKRPAATPASWWPPIPDLSAAEHALLRRMTLGRYGKALELGDVG